MLRTSAGEGVGVGDSVSKGVVVGDRRSGAIMCVVGSRGGAVTCVFVSSKGVSGVWSATARALTESGLQQRWRK